MMKTKFELKNGHILGFILIVATVLRFYNFGNIPFTHDEFSALNRLHFDNFHDLFFKGTIIDAHPPFVQVFLYYWGKLFGFSEVALKFPFALMGILSVYMIYLIGKKWFNETVGLLSASMASVVQYTIMYSQIARPYISGLLLCLLFVYYFTKIVQEPSRSFWKNGILFIIFGTLSFYNHYFSMLVVGIVGITGLFLIDRKFLLKYISLGLGIFLLFSAYLPYFFLQLSYGGVEEWLAKPKADFIVDYIYYIFHFSWYFLTVVMALMIWGLFQKTPCLQPKKYLILFIWFSFPFLIGYFYSVFVSAVLQYSVLIFSFPFLLFLLFAHIKNLNAKTNFILVLIICTVGTTSLIYGRNYYKNFYNSPYIGILKDYQESQKSNKKTLCILNSVPHINSYYLEKYHIDSTNYIQLSDFNTTLDFKRYLDSVHQHYDAIYLGTVSSIDPIIVPIIEEYFLHIQKQTNYWGATTYLFDKGETQEQLISIMDFTDKNWANTNSKFFDSTLNRHVYLFTPEIEWGPTFEKPLSSIIKNQNNFIDISVDVNLRDTLTDAMLVVSLSSKGKDIYWAGTDFKTLIDIDAAHINTTQTVYFSLKLSDIYLNYDDIMFKTFVWSKNKTSFALKDYQIKLRDGNPIIYGVNEP